MRRFIAILLSCVLTITGCTQESVSVSGEKDSENIASDIYLNEIETICITDASYELGTNDKGTNYNSNEIKVEDDMAYESKKTDDIQYAYEMSFDSFDDKDLHTYLQDSLYNELVTNLNNEKYFVENVNSVYVSQEYIDELTYNSKPNIYFGYTLEEINEAYEGTRYVFTLGDNNETIVVPFEGYDNAYEDVIKNVAIGTGVILICVTIVIIAPGPIKNASNKIVNIVLSASAKKTIASELKQSGISGVIEGVVTGIETGDMGEAVKAAAKDTIQELKWSAISGVVNGSSQVAGLKGATLNGLKITDAAWIQKESKYPLDVIKEFSDIKQYSICKDAGLVSKMINGKNALVKRIDLDYIGGKETKTNLELMKSGKAPYDSVTGEKYQLHHIGQKVDSTLAMLTESEHLSNGNYSIWHTKDGESEVHTKGNKWDAQRERFWKTMAKMLENGEIN